MESYEKKYKEALERAREIHFSKDEMEYIFPELKESEDERIRKWLEEHIEAMPDNSIEFKDVKRIDVLHWLEKQGEQKQEVNYPKFDYDDILALQCCMETAKKVTEDKELYEKLKSLHSRLHDAYWIGKQSEQKPTDKVEPKFKVGDTMRTLQEASSGITSGLPVVVSIDNQYYHCNNEIIAIKDQYNYEYPPMNKKHNDWSEEDEAMWAEISDLLWEGYKQSGSKFSWDDIRNWVKPKLKSLRHQSTWKPSDEQMKVLEAMLTVSPQSPTMTSTLIELYEDLKKLMEE